MATKNMARTVTEGGRTVENRCERRQSHRKARVRQRAFMRAIGRDPELAEDASPEPLRQLYREFHDKLGPLEAWLCSHLGEPWDDVYSQLVRQHDRRTQGGRHLIDHARSDVRISPYDVDRQGILRVTRRFSRRCARR